jgi:hypothetical protein
VIHRVGSRVFYSSGNWEVKNCREKSGSTTVQDMHLSVRFHLKSHDLTRKDATTPSLAK